MSIKKHQVNEEIRSPKVRVIDAEGNQLGVMETSLAIKKAKDAQRDLVEVSPQAKPPVCRMLDYDKFRFSKVKKIKLNKGRKNKQKLKEIKFRPNINEGDYQVKLDNILRFLERGDRVRVTVIFRGREMLYKEKGFELIKQLETYLEEGSVVEQAPKLEGRQLSMVLITKNRKG